MQTKDRNTEWKKAYRTAKQNDGICTECSRKATKGKTLCKFHLKQNRLKVAAYRHRLKGKTK